MNTSQPTNQRKQMPTPEMIEEQMKQLEQAKQAVTGAFVETQGSLEAIQASVKDDKRWRQELDKVLQSIRGRYITRERSLAITKIQTAIMWLGMDLKRLAPLLPPPDRMAEGRAGYERYAAVTEWKNFQGNPMPQWDALPLKIQEAWAAAMDKPQSVRNPYPESYNPESPRVEPTADGLKL